MDMVSNIDLTELENITVPQSSLLCLAFTALILIVLPVAAACLWHKKHQPITKLRYFFIGAAGFAVSARGLELLVHYFCLIRDSSVSRFINGSTVAYVLYGILTAGIFEECGRYLILRFLLKKDRTRENAVLYGIGHGGIEVFLVTLPQVALFLVIDILLSVRGMPGMMELLHITEETAAAALPSVLTAVSFSAASLFFFVAERAIAMCIHIALTVIVYYGIQLRQKAFLFLAILLHMAVDIFPALYQRAAVSLPVSLIWMLAWTVGTALIAVKLYRRSALEEN